MSYVKTWLAAARPRTWIASISPVCIATALGWREGFFSPQLFFFTLCTALLLQVGTNLANDYYDFVKGADTAMRLGPLRVTQAALLSPRAVKRGMVLAFVCSAVSGSYLILHGGLWIACLLGVSIILGILYTASPWALSYNGVAEPFAFAFFGPIAVAATYYLQCSYTSLESMIAGIGPGALSTALLVLNNVRDVEEDRAANKRTLVVRMGKKFGQWEYSTCLLTAFAPVVALYPSCPFLLLVLLALLPVYALVRIVVFHFHPQELNKGMAQTGHLFLLYTLLFCTGVML